jgi:hypothetical protein
LGVRAGREGRVFDTVEQKKEKEKNKGLLHSREDQVL